MVKIVIESESEKIESKSVRTLLLRFELLVTSSIEGVNYSHSN